MSDDKADAAPKKKGGKMKKLILFILLPVLLLGGGVAGGLMAAKKMGGGEVHKEDPDRPKLLKKDGSESSDNGVEMLHPNPEVYKSTYYPMEQPFTSNLSDTEGFLQIGLGVSTFYDAKAVDNLKDSDMPVRSAVLGVLAQQTAESLNTPQGKLALRKQLKDTINNTLRQREGFGGIDDVYFTSFIIQ